MEITRDYKEKEGYYNYYFHEDNKKFSIIFGGNLDLYWTINELKERDKNLTPEEIRQEMYSESKYTFVITKENYFIYSLFENLYNEIKDSKIFVSIIEGQSKDALQDDNLDFLKSVSGEEKNKWYKTRSAYQMLYDGEIIEWHSDDDDYHKADRVSIKKDNNTYILEFTCPNLEDDDFIYRRQGSASIRFRNSGSTYDPYNIIFMRMFNKLQEYNPEYHQIHFEEISYKRILKK